MINLFTQTKLDWSRYLYAYDQSTSHKSFIIKIAILLNNPNFFYITFYRIERYLITSHYRLIRIVGWLGYPLYYYAGYLIFDIVLPPQTCIGSGFYMHYKNIIFANSIIAGSNLSIIGPITIGTSLDGGNAAKIGHNVTICTGARIIGNISIGNNVIIGANAVVVKNIKDNCVVAGIPAKIIKTNKR